jgi:hypothetical protein
MSKLVLESDLDAFERIEKERALEIRLTARRMRRKELQERSRRNLKQSWPLAAGILLACLAPLLRDLAGLFAPWGTWILLPAVSLVDCKQLLLSSELRAIARQFALYAQFPIEAVIIKSGLKGRVSLGAVVAQLALAHILAAVFLWLLSRSVTS